MKKFFLPVTIFILGLNALAQDSSLNKAIYPGFHHAVSFGINCPLGDLADTHSFGFGAWYAWTPGVIKKIKSWRSKPTRLLLEGGLDYFLGKKDNYSYKNKGYTVLQLLTGVLYRAGDKSYYSFAAGLALDRYGNKTDPGLGTHLNGSFYVKNNIAVSPGLRFIKFKESDGLWIATVGATYVF